MPGPIEHHTLPVARTASYCVLGELEGRTEELWFALHGYGQLAREFLEELRPLERPGRVLVAPEGLSRFYRSRGTGPVGASWMTRERRAEEIGDYVRYLDLLAERVLGRRAGSLPVRALGFSQGAATAARWAVLGATRLAGVALWGSGFPPDLDPVANGERLRAVRWTFVLGERDASVDRTAVERDCERLRSAGLRPELVRFPGGHELDPATLVRLAQEVSRT